MRVIQTEIKSEIYRAKIKYKEKMEICSVITALDKHGPI